MPGAPWVAQFGQMHEYHVHAYRYFAATPLAANGANSCGRATSLREGGRVRMASRRWGGRGPSLSPDLLHILASDLSIRVSPIISRELILDFNRRGAYKCQ